MKIIETPLKGLKIIEPDIFRDDRGFFMESYNYSRYSEIGITEKFVQDNISSSVQNTIRGLHYQVGVFAQGKLCQVIEGNVLDVAVDIRFGSPTFGKYYSIILSGEKKNQIWIPPGFAHGFAVLSNSAIFSYKCTSVFNKENERSIIWNDPNVGVKWGIEKPIISDKDKQGKLLPEIEKSFFYK